MREPSTVLPGLTNRINDARSIITKLKHSLRRAAPRRFLFHAQEYVQRGFLFATSVSLLFIGQTAWMLPQVHAQDTMPLLRLPWASGTQNITQSYGCGDHNGPGYDRPWDQYSIDFGLSNLTDVTAVFNGAVHVLPYDSNGYGNNLEVVNGNWRAIYGHLDGANINSMEGRYVNRGDVIGKSGYSGYVIPSGVSGAHLHFALRYGGTGSYNGTSTPPESMSKYSGFGGSCTSGPYNPNNGAPGGVWQNLATPASGTSYNVGDPVSATFVANDNNNTGLNHVNITIWTQSQGWRILPQTPNGDASATQWFGSGITQANVAASFIMPNEPVVLSADVYSNNGFSQLSPNGTRGLCLGSQCPPQVSVAAATQSYGIGGGGAQCTIAPTTASSVSGTLPGNHGWWRSPAGVTLTATSHCDQATTQTYYRVNSGSLTSYTGPISFNQEGIYIVAYYSVDSLGNTEPSNTVSVQIDWTPPVTSATVTGPRDTNGIFRDSVTIGLPATDNLSGVDYQEHSFDGGSTWTNQSGNNNTYLISGNGVTRTQYRSTDIAGNTETAQDSGPIIINKYVMFSNSTAQSMRILYGTTLHITGDIFSNGTTKIYGNGGIDSSLGTTYSTVGAPNTISANTNVQIPTIATGVPSVPMLSYPLSLYQSLATVTFPSDLVLDSVGSTFNNIVYVNGNVDLYNVGLSGPLSIVATGTINDYTTDSTYQTNDPHNGVLLYAGQDINVRSTGNRNLGLMYAPNGTVKLDGATNLTLYGSLVGNQVEINGATTLNLSYSPAFASSTYSLPLAAMGLVIPTTTPPPLPSVPTPNKPNNGSTASSNKPSISWNASTGAIGYELQVSKFSSFSTLTYDKSQLGTSRKVTLSSATTYYWRVRAINQAGNCSWSTVWSFRTP